MGCQLRSQRGNQGVKPVRRPSNQHANQFLELLTQPATVCGELPIPRENMQSIKSVTSRIGTTLLSQQVRFKAFANRREKDNRPIFIIGTGRSGTHFLAKSLIQHSRITDLTGGSENPLVFPLVTSAAIDHEKQGGLLPEIHKRYELLKKAAAPQDFLDQSHPSLWFVEHLVDWFPRAIFIGIVRNPYSVVYSMLRHRGVRRWSEIWESFPTPNPFLGIRRGHEQSFREMIPVERCALRWASHFVRLDEVKMQFPSKVEVVSYEALCEAPQEVLATIQRGLGYPEAFPVPVVRRESLAKRKELSKDDRERIRQTAQGYIEQSKLSANGIRLFEELVNWDMVVD